MPSSVTTWNRANRRCPASSHHRSSTGHGPDQATMGRGGRLPICSSDGVADTSPRPVTCTGPRTTSSTRASTSARATVAGDGAGKDPGHGSEHHSGRDDGRSDVRSTTLAGTSRTCSPGPRPPHHSGTVTASGPSRPSTRASARTTRSSAPPPPHQNPSCRPAAVASSSGTSRTSVMPAVGRCAAVPFNQPSSCQRTRSATTPAVK